MTVKDLLYYYYNNKHLQSHKARLQDRVFRKLLKNMSSIKVNSETDIEVVFGYNALSFTEFDIKVIDGFWCFKEDENSINFYALQTRNQLKNFIKKNKEYQVLNIKFI